MSGCDTAAPLLGGRARRDPPLRGVNTHLDGGRAALVFEASTEDELLVARRAVAGSDVPVLGLGLGSNLLVSGAGCAGLVVSLAGRSDTIDETAATLVRAGGAVQLRVMSRRTAALGLTAPEWAVGVPGSVGGSARMN